MTAEPWVNPDDLRRPAPRVVAWARAHPVVIDGIITVIACVPLLAAMLLRSGEIGWWGYPLIVITAAVLMVRRRWPFAVLIVVAITCALSPLAQPGYGFPMIPFSFALYTVASRQRTWRALVGYGIALAVTTTATIPYSLSGMTPPLVSLTDPLSLIALVAGLLVKNRRQREQWLTDTVNQQIANAALAERTRIAAEMHDVVAHSLTVMVTQAGGALAAWHKYPNRSREAVEAVATIGREALDEMHHTLKLLRDNDATLNANLHHSGGNLPTLDELAARFREAGLSVRLTRTGQPVPDNIALRHTMYRIVQESLTNTLRHATDPTQATVTIDHHDNRIELVISDDGNPAHRTVEPGHGLIGIKERAAVHDGHVDSGPRAGGGWRTRVILNIPEPHTDTSGDHDS